MDHVDHAEEYRQLQQHYADLSDARLMEMFDLIDDYTEIAQQVLRAEIARRGLDPERQGETASSPVKVAPDPWPVIGGLAQTCGPMSANRWLQFRRDARSPLKILWSWPRPLPHVHLTGHAHSAPPNQLALGRGTRCAVDLTTSVGDATLGQTPPVACPEERWFRVPGFPWRTTDLPIQSNGDRSRRHSQTQSF